MPMLCFAPGDVLRFDYENHRGVTATRKVTFMGLDFGENEWYPEPQWFMRCWDGSRNGYRSFALTRIDGLKIEVIR
jgi:predicted DNA-binding transcriptional regulator YafY